MDEIASSAIRRPELTTAQLAECVGMPAGTLRMWETRYGFPAPYRLKSGHRRYNSSDADQLREVMRLRDAGMSLPAAILATQTHASARPTSIFARVRQRCAGLPTLVLEHAALLELSRAIEDDYLEQGSHGVVIVSFQRVQNFRAAQPRWRELARTASLVVALADFRVLRHRDDGIWEVPVARDHALGREWSLLLYSPASRGALAAWELPCPGGRPNAGRRFEVLLSSEPAVVHAAISAAAELLGDLSPEVGAEVVARLAPAPAQSSRELRSAAALAHRTVDYLLGSGRADA